MAAVINNYQEWATGIAVTGLKPLVGELTGNNVDAGQPFAIAAAIIEKVMLIMKDLGLTDIVEALLYVVSMMVIIVVFILISALIIVVTCEFYIVANIGVLLIGLGGSKIFEDYAVNVMRYVLSVAVKLFVMQLVLNIGYAMLALNDLDASIGSTLDAIKFSDLFFLIGKDLILLALAKTLPDTCAGIISGSIIGGGNPLIAAGRSAAAMVAASHSIAKADPSSEGLGAKGFMETAGGMAKTMMSARQQAAIAGKPGSMVNQLKCQANSIKALSGGADSGGGAAASGAAASSAGAAPSSNTAPASGSQNSAAPSAPKRGLFGGAVDMRSPEAALSQMAKTQSQPAAQTPPPPDNKEEKND
ncbi:MAG: type IV secretion system protein [Deltaproteobacteria bacterium]|nr:type IV secretion system protein [Deltaproteobacteria bacterium]